MSTDEDWDRPITASARRWRDQGWEHEAPALAAIKSLLRTQRMYLTRVDQLLDAYALNEARYEVLITVFLSEGGVLGHSDIARRLQVSAPAITSAVDKLQRAGYLTRQELAADRRQKQAMLTDLGRSVVLEATELMNAEVFGATELSHDELDLLRELLGKLSRSFRPSARRPARPESA